MHVFEEPIPIAFSQAPQGTVPGVAAKQRTLMGCYFKRAGLYWLTASLRGSGDEPLGTLADAPLLPWLADLLSEGETAPVRLPLYVQQRSAWQEQERARVDHLREQGLLPPH